MIGARPHANVYASVSNSITKYSDSIVCHHCRLHFVRIYISSLLVFSLSPSVILRSSLRPPLILPPPTYTGRQRNLPLPKRAHGWDMMTPTAHMIDYTLYIYMDE